MKNIFVPKLFSSLGILLFFLINILFLIPDIKHLFNILNNLKFLIILNYISTHPIFYECFLCSFYKTLKHKDLFENYFLEQFFVIYNHKHIKHV